MPAPTATSTESLTAGTSTKVALIQRTLRFLGDDARQESNTNNLTASGTSVTVATGAASRFEIGGVLDWVEDGTFNAEIIDTVADTALTLQTPRGAYGSTAAAHDGSATPKRFRYLPASSGMPLISKTIEDFIDQAVQSLWPDIPLVKAAAYTSSSTNDWYALPAETEDIYEVYQLTSSSPQAKRRPLGISRAALVDSGFSTTKKAVLIDRVDSSISTFNLIYSARHAATDLSSAAQDIVAYNAARLALESLGFQRSGQGTKAIFDLTTKVQLFRREEERLRSREAQRIAQYLPRSSNLVWRGRLHYGDTDRSAYFESIGHTD